MKPQQFKYRDLSNTRFFVPLAGGEVTAISDEGVVLWTVGLQPGIQFVDTIRPYLGKSDVLEVSHGVTVMKPTGQRVTGQRPSNAAQSGANPDYRPTSATQAQLEMHKLMRRIKQQNRALDKREKALATIGKTTSEPSNPVSEPTKEPEPPTELKKSSEPKETTE